MLTFQLFVPKAGDLYETHQLATRLGVPETTNALMENVISLIR